MTLVLVAFVVGVAISLGTWYQEKKGHQIVLDTDNGLGWFKRPYAYFVYLIGGLILFLLSPIIINVFVSLLLPISSDGFSAYVSQIISTEKARALGMLVGPFSTLLLQAAGICFMLSGGYKWLVAVGKILCTLAFLLYIPAVVIVPVA